MEPLDVQLKKALANRVEEESKAMPHRFVVPFLNNLEINDF